MKIVHSVSEVRELLSKLRCNNKAVGFVPTMGALHEGHLSLVGIARAHAAITVMSIFVNPTQFNSAEDLQKYPNTLESDIEAARSCEVDVLFIPPVEQIYNSGVKLSTAEKVNCFIKAGDKSSGFCGSGRPGHFDGVTTVVGILFNIIEPEFAVFGEKDYQQLQVIRQLVEDLSYKVRIIPGPLVRDSDGLALSSRNKRLDAEARYHALFISRSLFKAREMVNAGEKNVSLLKEALLDNLTKSGGLSVEYIEIVDTQTLKPLEKIESQAQLLVAVEVAGVRLIDNIRLGSN